MFVQRLPSASVAGCGRAGNPDKCSSYCLARNRFALPSSVLRKVENAPASPNVYVGCHVSGSKLRVRRKRTALNSMPIPGCEELQDRPAIQPQPTAYSCEDPAGAVALTEALSQQAVLLDNDSTLQAQDAFTPAGSLLPSIVNISVTLPNASEPSSTIDHHAPDSVLATGLSDEQLLKVASEHTALLEKVSNVNIAVVPPELNSSAAKQEAGLSPERAQQETQNEQIQTEPPGTWKWNIETGKKLLAFMVPAATVPMADPLQTMIDTVCIGQFSGAVALASLGPANVVFGFTAYLFASLQTAALSVISCHLTQGDHQTAQQVFSSALFVAVVMGVASMLLFEYSAPMLIKLTGVEASLIPLSSDYLRLRAIAQPAVLMNMVLNSCLLAQKNVTAPMTVVFLSSLTSLLGNLLFVGVLGWGVTGAALTTVASSYLACIILAIATQTSGQLRPRLKLPTTDEATIFLSTLGPLSIVYMCKNVSYMLVYTTATALHTMALAAHQAVFALWNMCAFTTNPFESAALTFYPSGSKHKQSFTHLLCIMGLFNGFIVGCIGAAVAFFGPTLLTSEPLLWPLISSVSSQLLLTLCFVGVDMAAAGILFARGDFNYLARSYFITLAALAGFLFAFCRGGWGLEGVWWALVFFQFVRSVQSVGRLVATGAVQLPFGLWKPQAVVA